MSSWERVTAAALTVVMLGGALWGVGAAVVPSWLGAWSAAGHSESVLHAALLMGLAAAWLGLLVYLGPMARSAPSLQWRADEPSARQFLVVYQVLCWAVAAVIALTLAVAPLGITNPAAWWAGGGVIALGVSLSLVAYAGERADALPWLTAFCRLLSLASLALLAFSRGDSIIGIAIVLTVGVVLVIAARHGRAMRAGDRPPDWLLKRAAENRWALHASLVLLDGSVARQVRERWRTKPVMFVREVPRALGRQPVRVATLAVRQLPTAAPIALIVAYLALCVSDAGSFAAGTGMILVGIGAVGAATAGPGDLWMQAPALRRTYTSQGSWISTSGSIAAMWLVALVGVTTLLPGLALAAIVLVVPPLVAIRRQSSRRGSEGAWVSSPMGAVPLGHVNQLIAGWDVVLLATLLVAIA